MQGLLQKVKQAVQAPFVQRVNDFSVADMIQYRRDAVRKNQWMPMGYLVGITFDADDASACESPEVQAKWARSNAPRSNLKRLLWHKKGGMPIVGDARNNVFVFPHGIPPVPAICDPSMASAEGWALADKNTPEIAQDPLDYVSGFMKGRDGTQFFVIRPITSICLVAMSSFFVFNAATDNATGTKPSFLFTPPDADGNIREAHIVGGLLLPTGR